MARTLAWSSASSAKNAAASKTSELQASIVTCRRSAPAARRPDEVAGVDVRGAVSLDASNAAAGSKAA